jgi:DNA polymerase III sliding clamp (beta) subunit (PCNA family)
MKPKQIERFFSKRTADFYSAITMASELVTEARFLATPGGGLKLVAMDPANVAMIILTFRPDFFSKFEWTGKFAINLSNLRIIFKDKKVDSFEIRRNHMKLEILFYGKDRSPSFTLPIIEMEEKDQKIPQLEHITCEVSLPQKTMLEIVRDADRVGIGSIKFVGLKDSFALHSEGDLSEYKEILSPSDKIKITATGVTSSKYSIEYLKKMFYVRGKLFQKIRLSYGRDYPLIIDYNTAGLTLQYILAPRVDND